MSSRFELLKQEEAHGERVAKQIAALKRWVEEKHPETPWCGEAMVLAFREEMGDAFLSAGNEDFEFALRTMRTTFPTQRVPTHAEVVAAENAHRKKLGVEELRELSRRENPPFQRPPLPNEWYGVDISTPQALRKLAKANIASFKALVERFGNDKVNEALGVQPAQQVGRSYRMKL